MMMLKKLFSGADVLRFLLLVLCIGVGMSVASAAGFDPEAATRAYLDSVPAEARARSDAYFTGGYWLQLIGLIYGLGVAALLLFTKFSVRLREKLAAKIRFNYLRTAIFIAIYTLVSFVLVLPLTAYEGFFREHAYGFATQDFASWFGEQAIGLGLNAIVGSLGFALLYTVVRKLRASWVLWAAAVSLVLMTFLIFISPVFIEPLFNDYKPMPESATKTEILRIAHANNIPTNDVLMVDASRQTNRVSANVSGLGSTVRIALNDNLLKRASPEGVAAVMGHEMGHYVLNHVATLLVVMVLVLALGFLFVDKTYAWAQRRFGARLGLGDIGDEAGLPIVIAALSVYMFLATPIMNTVIRTHETEADFFGLNASREPDGFAEAILMTAEYRKAEPGYWEEVIFFDHPSPRTRILNAMNWKAQNLPETEASAEQVMETK